MRLAVTGLHGQVVSAMIERAPQTAEKNLVILGCLSAVEEAEIRLECAAMGLPVPAFLPGESALDVPAIGKNTTLVPVHPYLAGACAYAKRERECAVPQVVFPYGPDGARAFYEALAAAFGKTVSYEARERETWAACEAELATLRGRSIAFCADAMLELSLARTLRAAGCRIPFVATPSISRKFHGKESALLEGVEVLERPDRFAVFERLSADHPDLVVANLNIANPLEGMGFNVKWSTELTFQPIHGFSGARALFALFASALRRHDALDRSRGAVGGTGRPIDLAFFREETHRTRAAV